jgi:hypothetical protein
MIQGRGMIVTSSFAAVSLSTCGSLCFMVIVVVRITLVHAMPCAKQTRASYFVAVYG